MSFLKKSLFLVLFLGFVSFSICEEEKREDEEEENEREENKESEEKRNQEERPPGFTPFRVD
uniref:[Thr6]-bradykinyl-Val,Asp n=1 Tax=Agalychnis dacnicolor TaxID=75988 RepID=BRKP1_AGADC|nr:RecName: Full=[Thr6]-bradykinyl-Val,Asp; AltName: Full=Bradykinin-related peptide RD-11; Contains: RecName: Full=[Thr6]-bradykinin; Flags: Precursor [Agalychnis dacnicolor]CCJ67650.1 Thr6-BK precusor [Agalychnis dacnicolor]